MDDVRTTMAPGEPSEQAGSTSATSLLLTKVKEEGEAAETKEDEENKGDDREAQSYPETEENECGKIMETVRALCSREEARLEGLSPRSKQDAESQVECLKVARQLMQVHLHPKAGGGEYECAAAIVSDARGKVAPHILRRASIWCPKASPAWMKSSMAALWCTTDATMRSAGCLRTLRGLKGLGSYEALKALLRLPRALEALSRPCMT